MTDEERRQVRQAALRDAAAIARIYIATKPDLEKSTNPQVARAFATVASHTAQCIERDILKLIENGTATIDPGRLGEDENPSTAGESRSKPDLIGRAC